jgi:hypothetical protein
VVPLQPQFKRFSKRLLRSARVGSIEWRSILTKDALITKVAEAIDKYFFMVSLGCFDKLKEVA